MAGDRTDTRDPRQARARALKIVFQADVRGEPVDEALARVESDPGGPILLDDLDAAAADPSPPPSGGAASAGGGASPLDAFTRRLVRGVAAHLEELDELIGRHARGWSVERMPAVDRSVLRLAAYELRHERTAAAVVINEALELAKQLSTESSGRYVNGVLEAVRRDLADGGGQRTGA